MREITREKVVLDSTDGEVINGGYKVAQIVDYILGIVETVLALRFLFLLFGANPNTGLASFIYTISNPLVAPFKGIFASTNVPGAVFDWSILVAMAVYAVVAYALVRLVEIATTDTTTHVYR
jgi:YggT family protein